MSAFYRELVTMRPETWKSLEGPFNRNMTIRLHASGREIESSRRASVFVQRTMAVHSYWARTNPQHPFCRLSHTLPPAKKTKHKNDAIVLTEPHAALSKGKTQGQRLKSGNFEVSILQAWSLDFTTAAPDSS